ncbi:hypothetical protein [Novosphingobium colocasiae]|uniref:Uncharacterized protein n=1 Tax=Novosphingobium colocasiae TaxID=1256513 RepID=A0A918PBW9_9SPHN|nr:hypothetical protein [Novosphingobium colocasiae]GGY96873.1 hypothetical protein GCM10011614_09760 [Novosphingobium colocasiae]
MQRIPVILSGAVAAALATAPALAAPAKKPAPAAAAAPGKAALEHAVAYFKVFVSAMEAKDVPEPVKQTLMGCIYSNPFGKIATGIDTIMNQNAGKLDRSKPNDVFNVLVRICGYNGPTNAPAPAPAPGAAGR